MSQSPTPAEKTAGPEATPAKRPAPPSDFESSPHRQKRQATDATGLTNGSRAMAHEVEFGSSASHAPPAPAAPAPIAQSQLRGMDSEDLVEMITYLQAAYMDNLASISAQYDEVRKELDELKSYLRVLVSGQLTTFEALNEQIHDIKPSAAPPRARNRGGGRPPPSHPRTPSLHTPAPSTAHPPPAPPATQPSPVMASPQQAAFAPRHPTPTMAATPVSSTAPPVPAPGPVGGLVVSDLSPSPLDAPYLRANTQPRTLLSLDFPADGSLPTVLSYSTLHTVREIWQEYRFGIEGMPSIESLEAAWQSRWRPDPKGRTWFSRRKIIWDKVKELIHDGLTEEDAVKEVERMRMGKSMNWLINSLVNSRKEVKASWKAAAAAAKSAKLNNK